MKRRMSLVLLGLVALCAAGGCQALGLGATPDQARMDQLAALVYPREADYGQPLDILVVRQGAAVTLINRTARDYHEVEIWLNQQYVTTLARLDIGPGTHLGLTAFVNRHGEIYPVGGLLTPDLNQKLLMAELFDPATGLRHHLLVQNR